MTEKELWLDFRDGNEDAFSGLFRAVYPQLYAYGMGCGMNPQQADDAIQDLFLRLYDKPSLVRNPDTLRPFLLRSVKNYYLNLCKRSARHAPLAASEFDFAYSIDETLIDSQESRLLRERIDRMLASLSPRQKEIVYLRFYLDLSYDEIGSVMNLSNQTARNLLHKAITNLRKAEPEPFALLLLIFGHTIL